MKIVVGLAVKRMQALRLAVGTTVLGVFQPTVKSTWHNI